MKTKTKINGYIIRSVVGVVLCSFAFIAFIAFSSAFNLSNRLPKSVTPVGASGKAAADSKQARTLTFAERVAYQRAIEEVYWRHRIWPKENADAKPSLDAVMSQAQIEKKVEDYLRDSQALEDYWQTPITPEQLQAEMERMAHHTKQPQVLREIFQALGDDPFVIAECLARPVLAERPVRRQSDVATGGDGSPSRPVVSLARPAVAPYQANVAYQLPVISSPSAGCIGDTWTPTSLINASTARLDHTAVWTGTEMIVWGGFSSGATLNTGGRYDPTTDTWTAASTTNAPEARGAHTAVWTGTEMIVWGGEGGGVIGLNTGGRYNPSTDSWTATSTTNAPTGREAHTAVWSGSEMIVWGGVAAPPHTNFNTGGRYNPSTDSWTATSTTNAPSPRDSHTAVWTGTDMIVWGGAGTGNFNTGGRYVPDTDSWTATSTTNVPTARFWHTAVWTGSEMIVWGGYSNPVGDVNTGGRYDPGADSWTATSTTNAPTARERHTAVWADSEMIIWGGEASGPTYFNSGGRYTPAADSWTATSTTNVPSGRFAHTAVWTATQMIVWGGRDSANFYLNTGGKYCAQSGATPTPTVTATATATATATSTPTATPRITPTPRSGPSPALRPTPPPHITPVPPPPSPRPTPRPRP